jgi:hypothetical protein
MDQETNHINPTQVANAEKLAVMANDIQYIKLAIDELKRMSSDLKNSYATKEAMLDLERRVLNLESNQTWAARTVLTSIVTALVSMVMAGVALIKLIHG